MSRFTDYGAYIEEVMNSWSCPGVAIAVVKGEEVLHMGAYGLRDVEQKLPMTEDTRFALASSTKPFTSMCIAMLVDEGKLKWDTPVREYMPEFILNDNYATQNVTVRDMLCHRTGMPRHDFAAWNLQVSREEFIPRMRHLKFNKTFREVFQYNNLMFYSAAYLVDKVSGQKYEDFVQERIFGPLKMTHSNLQPEPPSMDMFNTKGYMIKRDENGNPDGFVDIPYGTYTELSPGAAGGLFSTLDDLTRWLTVHANKGKFEGEELVSYGNLWQMHSPQVVIPAGPAREAMTGTSIFCYGLGWFIEPYRGEALVHHGGNISGFSVMTGCIPTKDIGVVVLTNAAYLPVRDLLMYESIDRALDLPDKDWNGMYHQRMDPIFKGQAKGKQTSEEDKAVDASPTHPPEDYCGLFTIDGYPDFEVKQEGDGYLARTVKSLEWDKLEHYHYNIFELHMSDYDVRIKIQYQVNDNGEIDAISIPLESGIGPMIFKRKPLELGEDQLNAVTGEYDLPMEGFTVTISVREGKVFSTQTGSPAVEIKPIKVEKDVLTFKYANQRLEFHLKDGKAHQLVIKTEGMTMELPRL